MNNKEFIAKAVTQIQNPYKEGKNQRMFFGNGTLYDYGFHFPLLTFFDGVYYLNADKYSVTTSRHRNLVRQELATYGTEKRVVELSTEGMKQIGKQPVKVAVTKDETCNGWTNWETWSANLWLTNDDESANRAKRCASAEYVKRMYKSAVQVAEFDGTTWGDHKDYDKVNWEEIFESLQQY